MYQGSCLCGVFRVELSENISDIVLCAGKKRRFCTVCASPIFSSNAEEPERLRIRLGLLDSDITERLVSHNFVSSKANWDNLDAKLPRYDNFEPSRTRG
jgi:hypothetical protein